MEVLMEHVGRGIGLILLLSMPAVLLAAGIGLVVGILQAVTQVQEQTIAAAPKIMFVFLLVVFGGPFMLDALQEYLRESVHLGMEVIPKDELMILPPKPRLAYSDKNSRMEFFKENKRPTDSKVKKMMETPSKVSGFVETAGGVVNNTAKPVPKAGVGEKIYLQRRAAGTLPQPPNRRDE